MLSAMEDCMKYGKKHLNNILAALMIKFQDSKKIFDKKEMLTR